MNCRKCSRVLPDDALLCCYCGAKQTVRKQNPKSKGNGTGSIYKNSARPGWMVAYTVGTSVVTLPDGTKKVRTKRVTKSGFKTKKEANEYLAGIISSGELRHSKHVPTVSTMYRQFVDSPGKKPGKSTMSAYATAFNKRINPSFGDIEIDIITIKHMEDCISGLTYDPAKDVKDLMSLLFQRAIADGYMHHNPSTLLTLPEKNSQEVPAWDPAEVEKLWISYDDGNRIAAACLLMIHTGMMPGELFALKKDMIDWDHHTISGCGLKTKERKERSIVLSDAVIPVLHDLCDTSPSTKDFVLGMNKDIFYRQFTQLKKDLNIRPEVRPYSSRHSTATQLELLGVSPSVIAQVLRHKNYATTAKHYISINNEQAIEAVSKLERVKNS